MSAIAALLACDNLRNNSAELGNFAAGRHISRLPKRKRRTEWEVIRLKATPAAFVGIGPGARQSERAEDRDQAVQHPARRSIAVADKAEMKRGRQLRRPIVLLVYRSVARELFSVWVRQIL